MTEHFDRAIEAGWSAYWAEVKRDDKSRMMDYRASYRAFTAALLEGLEPKPVSRLDYEPLHYYRRGFAAALAAIRERAGLGGNDAD